MISPTTYLMHPISATIGSKDRDDVCKGPLDITTVHSDFAHSVSVTVQAQHKGHGISRCRGPRPLISPTTYLMHPISATIGSKDRDDICKGPLGITAVHSYFVHSVSGAVQAQTKGMSSPGAGGLNP